MSLDNVGSLEDGLAPSQVCVFYTRGDYVHVSWPDASGHGWWVNGNCPATWAVVTVTLQESGHIPRHTRRVVVGRYGMAGRFPRRRELPVRSQHPVDAHGQQTRRVQFTSRLSPARHQDRAGTFHLTHGHRPTSSDPCPVAPGSAKASSRTSFTSFIMRPRDRRCLAASWPQWMPLPGLTYRSRGP